MAVASEFELNEQVRRQPDEDSLEQRRGGRDRTRRGVTVVDSCHSVWYFDHTRSRFRREVKAGGGESVRTLWRPFHRIAFDADSDAFFVFLDVRGARLLQSWRHVYARCERCGAEQTIELSLEDLLRATSGAA
jgi:hypothetical protein